MPQVVIYADGRAAGTLRWRQEGLYTRFEAELPGFTDLRRLLVCGGGGRGSLGVMEPCPAGLRLLRRLSRLELGRLPDPIRYAAAEARERPAPPPGPCFLLLRGRRYLALPCALRRTRPGLRVFRWEGRDYLLFRWERPL